MTALSYIWSDGAWRPERPHHLRLANDRFGEGQVAMLDEVHPRSKASHDHFFALVAEAWGTLPEHMAARFPTPDSLRHWALCKARYCDVETFTASSKAEAMRLAGFVRTGARDGVQVVVDGPSVTRLTPHSQSMKAMGGKVFQQSKTDCLEVIADLLDVPVEVLGMARAA